MTDEGSLRERLIDVGVDLVLTEGSASVGLREIARRAGVSHGAPRRHFPTHHALLSAIARRGFDDLAARFRAAVDAAGGPRDQLEALAREYVGYALEHRGMFELMFRHDLLDSTAQASDQPRLREATLPLFAHVTALVARCGAEPDTPPAPGRSDGPAPPATVTAAALWANLHGVAELWAWRSLPLVLGEGPPGDGPGDGGGAGGGAGPGAPGDATRDQLVRAVLDAHLGPVAR